MYCLCAFRISSTFLLLGDWTLLPLYEPRRFLEKDLEEEDRAHDEGVDSFSSQMTLSCAVIEHLVQSANEMNTRLPDDCFHRRDLRREQVIAAVLQMCLHASPASLQRDALRNKMSSLLRCMASAPFVEEGVLLKAIESKQREEKDTSERRQKDGVPAEIALECKTSLAMVSKLMKVHISADFGLHPFPSLLICFLQCNQFPVGVRSYLWQEMILNNVFKLQFMENDDTSTSSNTVRDNSFVPFATESYLWPLGTILCFHSIHHVLSERCWYFCLILADHDVKMLECYAKAFCSGRLVENNAVSSSLLLHIAVHHLAHAIFQKSLSKASVGTWTGLNLMKRLLVSGGVANKVLELICSYGYHVPLAPGAKLSLEALVVPSWNVSIDEKSGRVTAVLAKAIASCLAEKNESNTSMLETRKSLFLNILGIDDLSKIATRPL